ncbi:MAG: MMPL family transporter [Rhodospirillales bacterium]|nr:MMPL family transporter [Rhodospirillales bacterium]
MQVLSSIAADKPKRFMWVAGLLSLVMILLVAIPTLAPGKVPLLQPLHIDTDPENMLSADEPVRVFHNAMKKEFALNDIIVVGVVNKVHKNGAFNAETLKNVYELTETAKQIRWEDPETGKMAGVLEVDLLAPSTVDNIEQAGLGTVRFEWLMAQPPQTDEEALAVAEKAQNLPFLDGTLISEDRKAIALYVPITSKNISYKVAKQLEDKIASFGATQEEYHITGMPVAQDTFGVEMFKQMAMSAPLAMLLIFLLMWYFFKNIKFIISPMIVALVSVICTMGALIATGHTVHIMSSMIPVFIMPIAVLDAVHILSDFFDRYPQIKDRRKTLDHVMEDLSKPMLFTSLTTTAGFASLAFTPIPPVETFGIFIALGVLLAYLFTITLIPAYIMLMSDKSMDGFGLKREEKSGKKTKKSEEKEHCTPLACFLKKLGPFTYNHAKLVLLGVVALSAVAVYGITKIQINDNPVKWFSPSHKIRVADRELNDRFAGTYMGYLTLASSAEAQGVDAAVPELKRALIDLGTYAAVDTSKQIDRLAPEVKTRKELLQALQNYAEEQLDVAEDDALYDQWDTIALWLDEQAAGGEVFKDPEVLHYIEKLQAYLLTTGLVGKSNALPDIIKTVHRELFLGEPEAYRIPDSVGGVAQTLITYQNSHRPDDLWHFVTPDYSRVSLWIQLKSGDNKDMNKVVASVEKFFAENEAPIGIDHQWFGLTYINTVWQDKMVSGMAEAFAGSFVIVLGMMIFLFRSVLWGVLSMIPLTVTIAFIYGLIGLIGKDYDMPVAVLSSLSLGLAVDYAIHFLARGREMQKKYGSWKDTVGPLFGEPGRAIARNVIIIGVGFLPLLAAPLVPYKTVGFFISAILLFAGAASLVILPALMTLLDKWLFKEKKTK